MSSRYAGQVAIVTGGASGIGRALGVALHEAGAVVILADLDGEGAARAAAVLDASGARAQGRQLDVTDAGAVQALVEAVVAEHGRLDLMVNNAGVGLVAQVRDTSLAEWSRLLDVNLRGVIHGVAAAYPVMIHQGSGCIVNVSSLAGLVPTPGLAAYSTTKHAVVGLSQALRAEGRALGVRVSCVCPGMVATPILDRSPFQRLDADLLRSKLTFGAIPPEACARAILRGLRRDKGLIVVSAAARLSWFLWRFAPWLVWALVHRMARTLHQARREDPAP